MSLDLRPDRTTELFGGGVAGGPATDHGTLTGLGDDDHSIYVHTSNARTVTARHTFNPSVASSPFILGANAIGQLVAGFNSDELDGSDSTDFAAATHNHAANEITSGQLALARGGSNADMSATGGALFVVKQLSAGAAFTAAALLAAEIPNLSADKITADVLADARISTTVKRRQLTFVVRGDDIAVSAIFHIPVPWDCTIKRLEGITDTGTVTYNVEERAAIGTPGVDVLASDQVADVTGEIATSFSNADIDEGDYLTLTISALASSPTEFEAHLEVEID